MFSNRTSAFFYFQYSHILRLLLWNFMSQYLDNIKTTFSQNSNSENAFYMKKYMKNKFDYYGIKSPLRKEISKQYLKKENLPPINEFEKVIKELWNEPQRELQYFAMELLFKYSKQLEQEQYLIFEHLLTNKSWWDTIDYIAANLVGNHFKKYPHLTSTVGKRWIESDNMWLNRTAILFQLKYKQATDEKLLSEYILIHASSKEFFIRKAIGWALREYSKTNSQSVIMFVHKYDKVLSGLSKREALKVVSKI